MTAKEYLGQAYRIDQRINSKLEQICSLRELATKATSTLTDMPRSNTHNPRSMESIIAKMVDLEDKINEDIDALVDLKLEIVTAIKNVDNIEYQVLLEKRFLCYESWEQIAHDMNYSVRWVHIMFERALNSADKVLSERGIL